MCQSGVIPKELGTNNLLFLTYPPSWTSSLAQLARDAQQSGSLFSFIKTSHTEDVWNIIFAVQIRIQLQQITALY